MKNKNHLTPKQAEVATMYICTNGHITVSIEHVIMCKVCDAGLEIVSDELPF